MSSKRGKIFSFLNQGNKNLKKDQINLDTNGSKHFYQLQNLNVSYYFS
jgi:hypothetical protein